MTGNEPLARKPAR